MGIHDLTDSTKIVRRVKTYVRHNMFDSSKMVSTIFGVWANMWIVLYSKSLTHKLYDVALLTLNSSVPFSSNVAPVCLNGDTKINHDGTDVVTAGWGRLSESIKDLFTHQQKDIENEWFLGGKKTTRLQKVTLQIKSLEECRKNLGSKAPGGVVDHYICAWAPSRDSCSVSPINCIKKFKNFSMAFYLLKGRQWRAFNTQWLSSWNRELGNRMRNWDVRSLHPHFFLSRVDWPE